MDTLTIVLLAVIAEISIVQTTLLVRLSLDGFRTARGLERLADRLVRDLTPAARDISRAAANTGELAESVRLELQRIDALAQETAESWSRAREQLYDAVMPTLGR